MHRLSAVTLAITLISATMVTPVVAAGSFACEKAGGSQAIVNACGAGWTAATLRVHIAARNYGGDTEACLAKTAALLEMLATKWVATGAYSSSYKLPCGKMPAVASADDGLLAKACPNSVWSYANRGKVNCDTSMQRLQRLFARNGAGPARAPAPVRPASDQPGYDETAQWLADNVPILANYQSNGINVRTTGFSVRNCIVTWQLQGTHSDGSTLQWADIIPFSLVSSVASDTNDGRVLYGIKITTSLNGNVTNFAIGTSSQNATDGFVKAFRQLAELCRAQKAPAVAAPASTTAPAPPAPPPPQAPQARIFMQGGAVADGSSAESAHEVAYQTAVRNLNALCNQTTGGGSIDPNSVFEESNKQISGPPNWKNYTWSVQITGMCVRP